MSDGQRKQERDFTPEVTALLPEVEKLAKDGQLQAALDKIGVLEKQTRNAADLPSTSTLLVKAITLCHSSHDLDLLNSQLQILSRKHGQLKEATVRMVDQAMTYLPDLKSSSEKNGAGKTRWLELLETLRDITEGKIHLELQRARLTRMLAGWHEELALTAPTTAPEAPSAVASTSTSATATENDKPKPAAVTVKDHRDAAADLMSEIQVETYSSMDKREKTDFILEQMRLESQRGMWPRVRVGGRKINRAFLKEEKSTDLKLRYYELMIQLALHEDAYLDACKAYQEVWDTDEVKKDDAKSQEAIECIISFIILSPYDNEQSDMLHKLYANQELQKVPMYYELLKSFVTQELMRWPGIEQSYAPILKQSMVFAPLAPGEQGEDFGTKRWKALHSRVIEHNIRVIAGYYTQITMARLTDLLDLPPDQAESTLCKLVTDKTIHAKIDRPAGIVNFTPKKGADELLNEWSGDLGKMLSLIEKTGHLINKEYAIHAARSALAA